MHLVSQFIGPVGTTPEGIIWVVFVLIWGIARAINQGKRTLQPREMPRPPTGEPPQISNELRELLEAMGGTNMRTPSPPARPKPADRVVVRKRRVEQTPTPPPVRRPAPLDAEPVSTSSTAPQPPARERPAIEQGMVFQNVVVPVRAMDMPDAMRLSLTMPSFGREEGVRVPDLSDLQDLRKAVLYAVILGPPKALEHLSDR